MLYPGIGVALRISEARTRLSGAGAPIHSGGGRYAIAQTVKGITVQIGGETKKLSAAIKSLNSDAKSLQRELKGINTLLKLDPKNVTLLKQKQDLLNKSLTQTQQKLAKLKAAQAEADAAMAAGVEVNEEEYRNLQREIAYTEQRLKSLTEEQARFSSIAAVQVQEVGKEFTQLGEKMTAAGQALLPLTAAIGVVGVASVAASIQFESSFAGVKKTVNATTQELEALAEASREAALTTPVDVNSINYIKELGGQLGIATENLNAFAEVIAALDVSTDMNLDDASMQLAQLINISGIAQEDIDRLGSTIVALGNTSATTESMIVDFAMRIAGTGQTIGLTIDQVLGLSASMASVGIQAEMGGSAISTVLSSIDKSVAMNGESLQTWAATAGMSAQEFAKAWEEDAASAFVAVIAGMEEASLSGSNLNLILDELGVSNIRQTDTLKRLTSAASLMANTMNTANAAWDENTALMNEASQRYGTTESKLTMLGNKVYEVGIAIGNGLKNAVAGAIDILNPMLDVVIAAARAFENANPAVQSIIIGITGMTASIAPLLIIGGKLTSWAGNVVAALGKAAAAMVAKASATNVDTAATTANTAALNLQILRQAVKDASDARAILQAKAKAASTAADTAATAANTAATTANATATSVSTIRQVAASVATKANAVATGAATIAQLAWNAAMKANPIGAVMAAVGALVAVLGSLAIAIANVTGSQDKLTKATQDQQEKVDELQASYDEAVAAHGEHSDAAVKAKAALEEEQATLEASKETMEEFIARCEDTVAAHEEFVASADDVTRAADSQAGMVLNLADRIAELAAVEGKTAEQKAELTALTASLTQSCESLTVSYDTQNDTLSMNVEALRAAAEAEADRLRSDAAMKSYQDLLEEEVSITADLAAAQEELDAETQSNIETWGMLGDVQVYTSQTQLDLQETVDSLTEALDDNRSSQMAALEISARYATRQSVLALALEEVESGALSAEEAAAKYADAVEGGITADDILAEQAHQAAIAQAELATALNETEAAMTAYLQAHPSFQEALEASGLTVEEFSETLASQGVEFEDASKDIEKYSSKAASAFDKIADSSSNSLAALQETLAYNLEATENWGANLEAVFGRTGVSFSEEFVNAVRAGGVEQYGTVMAELSTMTDEELQAISDSFAANGQAGVEAYLAEQELLVPGMKEALDETGEAIDEALGANAGNAAEIGEETGRTYTASLATALSEAPEEVRAYVTQLESELDATGVAESAGGQTGSAFSDSLGAAIAACPAEVRQYIAQLETELASFQEQAGEIGATTGTSYGQNAALGMQEQAGAVSTSAAALKASAQGQLDQLPDTAGTAGTKAGSSFSSGILGAARSAAASAATVKASAESQLSNTNAGAHGQSAGNAFASGIGGTYQTVASNAATIAACCKQWAEFGQLARTWGWDAGSQFASGLESARNLVRNAATAIASAARSILHFSVPDEGPLADADEYGPDFGMLIAEGLLSTIGEVRSAATEVAQAAREEMNAGLSSGIEFAMNLTQSEQSVTASPSGLLNSFGSAVNLAQSPLLGGTRVSPAYAAQLANSQFGSRSTTEQTSITNNNFYGSITLSASEVKDIQTFDDFAKRLQKEMRML